MQKDLDRFSRRNRRKRNIVVVIIVSVAIAFLGVGMRACADQFSEPYNKDYTPVDSAQGDNGVKR